LTETVRVAGVVPLLGVTESQLPPEVVDAKAVKLKAAPVLATLKVWLAGTVPPIAKANDKEPGLAPRPRLGVILRMS